MPPLVLDIQALQSPGYRERGVARYTLGLATALVERHPDLVDSLLLNPDLPPPSGADALLGSGKVRPPGSGARLFHALSPFELDVPLAAVWPRDVATRRLRTVVTVYDLIP